MKKYLMSGVAAIAFLAAFTSCSKSTDLYDQGAVDEKNKQEQQKKDQQTVASFNEKYAAAFEAAYGKVAPTVDWGFGSGKSSTRALTRAKGDYDHYKGNLEPVSVSFPSDAPASNFDPDLTGIPSYEDFLKSKGNANWTPTEINESAVVYIDHVRNVKMTGGNERSKLYIKAGEYDFTDEEFNVCANADVYLLSGAVVTLNNTAANTAKFNVYIASGAKLIANGENGYRADVDAHVYNHGTIECTRFEVNGTGSLYNVGALKVPSGDVYIANSTSRIVNDGTINAASTHVEGSGALQNNAEWTVTGNTIVNCTDGGWVNNGHWKTQNYYYTAGSSNVINNCFLEVTEDFNINMSSATSENGFKIDSNGGVKTKNFYGGKDSDKADSKSGPYKVIMGQKSVFKVTGTATLEGGNPGWGFFGPSSGEYAVFQAKDIVRNPELAGTQGAVTYSGNLYVSAETHFGKGTPYDTYIYEEGGFSVNTNIYAEGFNPGKPDVTIQQTPCNPGFQGKATYRVIAEDLNAEQKSDFDFNDVVFDVEPNETGTAAKIVLQAAGGIYKLTVGDDAHEIHQAFGASADSDGLYPMINTENYDPKLAVTLFESYTGQFDTDANIRAAIKDIPIIVYKPGSNGTLIPCTLTATTGEPACKILVDKTFGIVKERQDISNQYKKFTKYVGGFVDDFWWK